MKALKINTLPDGKHIYTYSDGSTFIVEDWNSEYERKCTETDRLKLLKLKEHIKKIIVNWKDWDRLHFFGKPDDLVPIFNDCLEELETEGFKSPYFFSPTFESTQFEIIWQASGNTRVCAPNDILSGLSYKPHKNDRGGCGVINGECVYSRILIRKKLS